MSTLRDVYFNSHDISCRDPFGAVRPGTRIDFMVDTKELPDVTCYLNYYQEMPGRREIKTIPMKRQGGRHTATLVPMERSLYFYWFSVTVPGQTLYYGNSHDSLGGIAVPYEQEIALRPYQITVHDYDRPAPAWYREAIFYQIFPDRFCNGNEDGCIDAPKPGSMLYADWYDTPYYIRNPSGGIERWEFSGGNLKGIRSKLDYLQDFGISGIYLNPIFEARSNHRYDTGDYHTVDPMLGSNAEFEELMADCEERGIGVILDGVFNHTGDDSIYFNARGSYDSLGASQSKASPYYEWYKFRSYPKDYECWWGVTDLPNVNEEVDSFREFIMNPRDGVIPYWLRKGAGGWRLDVADELPGPFIRGIRQAMDREGTTGGIDPVLIGEVWEDASNKISYSVRREYLMGRELHGVMNYPFKEAILRYLTRQIRAEDIYRIMMSLKENYPREAFYASFNFLGTHDTPRVRTELGETGKLRLAAVMLMTLPGVPCIYYGDEAGLTGERDPYNRATYPWGREDPEIMAIYRGAIALRKSSKAFTEGEFRPFFKGDVFGYIRSVDRKKHIMAFNPTDQPKEGNLILAELDRPVFMKIPAMDFIHVIEDGPLMDHPGGKGH